MPPEYKRAANSCAEFVWMVARRSLAANSIRHEVCLQHAEGPSGASLKRFDVRGPATRGDGHFEVRALRGSLPVRLHDVLGGRAEGDLHFDRLALWFGPPKRQQQ